MPDVMSSPTEMETNQKNPENVEIVETTVIKDRMDSARMSVRFIVAADSPAVAFAFAQESALMEEGLRLVRKEGLLSPGVSGQALPIPCNENGEPSANPMGVIDPNAKQRYYYSVTYDYLGED
jgi:hypothetical protein